jgi:hypothetical protein
MMNRSQPVPTHAKQILNDAVHVQETLRVGGRRAAAHLTFSLSRGLVRDFGAIVRVSRRVMGDQRHDVPMGDTVAAQLVGHDPYRFLSLILQESAEESPRCTPVPTAYGAKKRPRVANRKPVLACGPHK